VLFSPLVVVFLLNIIINTYFRAEMMIMQRGNGLNSSRKTRKIIFVGTFSAKYFFYLQIYLSLQPLREMKRKTMAP
jgi:hypothetical protein